MCPLHNKAEVANQVRDALSNLWQAWKRVALRIGHWQTRGILSLLYFTVMMPVAVGVRILADPLGVGEAAGRTRWRRRVYITLALEQARKQ